MLFTSMMFIMMMMTMTNLMTVWNMPMIITGMTATMMMTVLMTLVITMTTTNISNPKIKREMLSQKNNEKKQLLREEP